MAGRIFRLKFLIIVETLGKNEPKVNLSMEQDLIDHPQKIISFALAKKVPMKTALLLGIYY